MIIRMYLDVDVNVNKGYSRNKPQQAERLRIAGQLHHVPAGGLAPIFH
jgi:hypothetical protein